MSGKLECGFTCFYFREESYKQHQELCDHCEIIPFRWINHLKFNVVLRCMQKHTRLHRADYNAHRGTCKKCHLIPFRNIQTAGQYIQTKYEFVYMSFNSGIGYTRKLSSKVQRKATNAFLHNATSSYYCMEHENSIIVNGYALNLPNECFERPPSQESRLVKIANGYVAYKINTVENHSYCIGPLREDIWSQFQRNLIKDANSNHHKHVKDMNCLPISLLNLVCEYCALNTYEMFCITTRFFLALHEKNNEAMNEVPILRKYVEQNQQIIYLIEFADGAIFKVFLERVNVFYSRHFTKRIKK